MNPLIVTLLSVVYTIVGLWTGRKIFLWAKVAAAPGDEFLVPFMAFFGFLCWPVTWLLWVIFHPTAEDKKDTEERNANEILYRTYIGLPADMRPSFHELLSGSQTFYIRQRMKGLEPRAVHKYPFP